MASSASRFAELSEKDLQTIVDGKDAKQTKAVIQKAVGIFSTYCGTKDLAIVEAEQLETNKLCIILRRFYAEIRTKGGEFYAKKSMQTIRYGLQRHFLKLRQFDIVNDSTFQDANEMFTAMMVKLKEEGKGAVKHKEPIEPEDMIKIRSSAALNQHIPRGLQNKVFIDIMLHMSQRGRENLREMESYEFEIKRDANNRRYVMRVRDRLTKNHRLDDARSQAGVMYETPQDPENCPVNSLEKYLMRLNPNCDAFWQRPKPPSQVKDDDVWYDNVPVGKNKLYNKMKELSEQANTSQVYTNHCLRATNVTLLDEAGFEARHIMSVTGHRSEASIRSYSRTGINKKRKMSAALSTGAYAVSGENVDLQINRDQTVSSVGLGLQQTASRCDTSSTSGSASAAMLDQPSTSTGATSVTELATSFLSSSQEELILNDLTKSPTSVGLNIGVSRQFHQSQKAAAFNFHNCNVSIYNS